LVAGIDTKAIAGQIKQVSDTVKKLSELLEAKKGVAAGGPAAADAAAPAAPAAPAADPAKPAAPADQNITLKDGQAANVGLEQPPANEQPQAGGPAPAGDQTALLKELLGDLTKLLKKIQDMVQQMLGQGLGALTGGDQKADLTKPDGKGGPAAAGADSAPGAPVKATGEPKWNGDGTYTVPTADGPKTVPGGTPIDGYSWGKDNHYKENATGKTVHDPLKIALDGSDAQLNTTDHAKIKMEDGTVKEMSGGLNGNEAWLAKDRDGKGITKNGVIDGEDLFGDHMGQYKHAYDQLAKEYAGEIKTDANGKRYIDLTDPNSKAAKELKLVDKSGKSIPASSKMNKIYVDHEEVNKTSADNQTSIRQQGDVEFKDGHKAKAVDQWFSA
jgi:hypothetical protein